MNKTKIKIGVLGGSFDPAHKGHLAISKEAKKRFKLKKVIWAITKKNPFKIESKTSVNDRIKYCKKIIGDKILKSYYNGQVYPAKEKDWSTEYLASIVSVKIVKNSEEAIKHINKYGTMHTDSIITKNKKTAKYFLKNVKSSIAMHNTSTQFADGGEFGFGGEVGISTNTLPPRGPVGLNQLISYKYEITSNGRIRN